MKIFWKKNKIYILILAFLLIWVSTNLLKYSSELKKDESNYNALVYECSLDSNYLSNCEEYLNDQYRKPDTITSFFYILCHYNLNLLQIIAPLFIIIPSVWNFHKRLKSGYIKNALMLQSYKSYIFREIFDSMKSIFILPITLLFLFLGCYLISGHFDYTAYTSMLVVNSKFLDNLPLLMLVYFINIFLHSIFYINLGLIFCKRNRNILVSIIASYICFILLDLFLEVLVGSFILGKIMKLHGFVTLFNLFGIWLYTDYTSLLAIFIFSLLLATISLIVMANVYRKKEEVVICCEE